MTAENVGTLLRAIETLMYKDILSFISTHPTYAPYLARDLHLMNKEVSIGPDWALIPGEKAIAKRDLKLKEEGKIETMELRLYIMGTDLILTFGKKPLRKDDPRASKELPCMVLPLEPAKGIKYTELAENVDNSPVPLSTDLLHPLLMVLEDQLGRFVAEKTLPIPTRRPAHSQKN